MRLLFGCSLALLGTISSGCIARAFFTDGSSVSLGKPNRGVLRGGRMLPTAGEGYVVPPLWTARGALWGTDELVSAIENAARRVAREHPGGLLGIGDLSQRGGGDMGLHKSHESGRDADLIFYAVDESGAPVPPVSAMPRYTRKLKSRPPFEVPPEPVSPRRFDLQRNWALVRALVEDQGTSVEYLFIAEKLKDKLIDYARARGEPETLVKRASMIMRQPAGTVLPHDDHLHLRLRCDATDKRQGCVDEGKVRLRSEIYRGEPVKPTRRRISMLRRNNGLLQRSEAAERRGDEQRGEAVARRGDEQRGEAVARRGEEQRGEAVARRGEEQPGEAGARRGDGMLQRSEEMLQRSEDAAAPARPVMATADGADVGQVAAPAAMNLRGFVAREGSPVGR